MIARLVMKFARHLMTDTGKSVLWLWETDQKGWEHGTHSILHTESRVGIWTANSTYGLQVAMNVPADNIKRGHILDGDLFTPPWADRFVIYNTIRNSPLKGGPIPDAIHHWAMNNKDKVSTNRS